MNVLVTGGAGFIGSHLVDRLLLDGHKVIILDRFSDGTEEHFVHGKLDRNLTLHHVDFSKREEVKFSYFRSADWVFHLAGLAKVAESIVRPLAYHTVNLDGTIYVLEHARRAGVKKFIFTGSASYYGIADIYPTSENAEIKLDSPYALTKYAGEQYSLHWGQVYKLPVIALRLFNVYGPKIRKFGSYGPLVSRFISQKMSGKPISIVGDGEQTRDFTFVSDVVDAFITAAKSTVEGQAFNVGSGESNSINRLVELLGGKKTYIPKRKNEPQVTYADISKIYKQLRWKPKVSLDQGIAMVLRSIGKWEKA